MNKKQLRIFVAILFTVIGIGILLNVTRQSNVYNEIQISTHSQITNVHFFKDFLRDDSGLNAPITSSSDLEEFISIIKNMQTWNGSIKSLKVNVSYKIRFTLNVKKERLITISVYDTGETAVLSISQGDDLVTSAGNFSSYEILQWIKNMEQKSGFENIKCIY